MTGNKNNTGCEMIFHYVFAVVLVFLLAYISVGLVQELQKNNNTHGITVMHERVTVPLAKYSVSIDNVQEAVRVNSVPHDVVGYDDCMLEQYALTLKGDGSMYLLMAVVCEDRTKNGMQLFRVEISGDGYRLVEQEF